MEWLNSLANWLCKPFEFLGSRGLEWWKNLAETCQAAATIVAIIAGGIWTYFLFIHKRLRYPRVSVTIASDVAPVTNEGRLVHAEIVIENKGDVMLKSKSAQLRLRQVAPVPDEICGCAQQNIDPVPDGKTEIEWPCIAQRDWNWKEGEFEVEPGESDYLHADFLIPHSISVVELYFFLANPAKSHKGLGWTRTKIHRFDEREDDKTMAKETSLGQQKLNEQQKLQKQQKPQQPQIQQQQKPQQLPQQKPK